MIYVHQCLLVTLNKEQKKKRRNTWPINQIEYCQFQQLHREKKQQTKKKKGEEKKKKERTKENKKRWVYCHIATEVLLLR